ncbi:hypothetical protein WJX81_000342 [Elliptochloris bilobata]|uniref:HECT-type E3 ubiquitin transferase n=1 Tax=Elliptochloris bilobata TaxID=381761 RepID=A0AAW1QJ39_9CHLO
MGEGDADDKLNKQPLHRSFSQWFISSLPGSWGSSWELDFSWHPGHDDYRDRLPTPLEDVVREYEGVVKHGEWTFGLCQCWGKRSKVVKSAVHVPCCPSFRFLPWRWRGVCFGRTFEECCWFGCDRLRWARTTHAMRVGREYIEPFHRIGSDYRSDICALCWFQVCVGCAAGLGCGQAFSLCGNVGANFGAWYSCHAREKLRRKFDLPPTFGLCAGVDDCVTHFFCMYCASHQEMRECAVRGLDGPGLYALDVHPQTWAHLPGYDEALERRAAQLEALKERGDLFLPFEQRMSREPGPAQVHGKAAVAAVQALFSHEQGSSGGNASSAVLKMCQVKVKKSVEVPAPIRNFVDSVLRTPAGDLAGVLETFSWSYEKGDFHHWVALFNHFDALFDGLLKPRADLQLSYDQPVAKRDPPFPSSTVVAVLRVTATILENCSNKHLYHSYDHLTSLLAAPDPDVVAATLQALVAFVRKTHVSSVRWHGNAGLNDRLLALSQGWGGKEEGLDLVACTQDDEASIQPGLALGTTLHFEFYQEAAGQGAGLRVIHLPRINAYLEAEHDIVHQLVQRYGVPEKLRFSLLTRVRIARHFGSLDGRRQLARVRLLAFYVLFQSSPNHDDMMAFFVQEAEFVSELVGLLQAGQAVPEVLRTLALRALAVQLMDRTRHSSVIAAISIGGQSGLLSQLMHSAVSSLAAPGVPAFSVAFVEALLSLVGALVSSTSGCAALSEAGLIPALLPLLGDGAPGHVGLVSAGVRILEAFMDFSPAAATLFRDLGGLSDMIRRLAAEVAPAALGGGGLGGSAAGAGGDAGPSGGAVTMQMDMAPGEAAAAAGLAGLSSGGSGGSSSDAPAEPTPAASVPYTRRLLLKSLLRAIALASYAPGTGARPQEGDQAELYSCLRTIFERGACFGGGLFALAASVMTDLIHHDPLCFRALDDAGLPQAFLDAVTAGVLPSGEAVCCVPNTLVALCLNTGGLARVRSSRALRCFVPIFTSRQYLRALQGDTPSILGSGLDELMRHAGAEGGGGSEEMADALAGPSGEGSGGLAEGGSTGSGPVAMATDGAATPASPASTPPPSGGGLPLARASGARFADAFAPAAPAVPPPRPPGGGGAGGAPAGSREGSAEPAAVPPLDLSDEPEPGPAADAGAWLAESVSHAARMLEPLLGTADSAREFVARGGARGLLALYALPALPPTFGSSAAAQALLAAVRTLAPGHPGELAKELMRALLWQLATTYRHSPACSGVLDLPAEERDAYVRRVSAAEGLLNLGAQVVRTAQPMLGTLASMVPGLHLGVPGSPIDVLSHLHRRVLWQLAVAEEARRAAEAAAAAKLGEGEPGGSGGGSNEGREGAVGRMAAGGAAGGAPEVEGPEGADLDAGRLGGAAEPADASAEDRDAVETGVAVALGRRGKKSGADLAFEVLQHFATASRAFLTACAKAVHTPTRRREELSATPTAAMCGVAVHLAAALRNTLLEAQTDEELGEPDCTLAAPEKAKLRHYYLARAIEDVGAVLFDQRRRTCHSLVVNYWVACGGLGALLQPLAGAGALLLTTPDSGVDSEARLRRAPAERTACTLLAVADQLVDAPLLLGSPQAAVLLAVPPPGAPADAQRPSAEDVVKRIQSEVLGAAVPLLRRQELGDAGPRVVGALAGILIACSRGTAAAAAGAGAARAGALAGRAPAWAVAVDAVQVQQIIEMGFPQAAAELALRRVGGHGPNAVELAIEWLTSHPAEVEAVTAPAAAPAGGGAEAPVESSAEDVQLAAVLGPRASAPTPHAAAAEQACSAAHELAAKPAAEVPTPHELAYMAIFAVERQPEVAFPMAELLAMQAATNPQAAQEICKALSGVLRVHDAMPYAATIDIIGSPGHAPRSDAVAHLLALLLHGLAEQGANKVLGDPDVIATPAATAVGLLEAWVAPAAPQGGERAEDGQAAEQAANGQAAAPAADAAAAPPAAAPPPAPGEAAGLPEAGDVAAEEPAAPETWQEVLADTYRPGDGLSDEMQERVVEVALALLRHLHAWDAAWVAPSGPAAPAHPEPASTAQAVLQLLTRLTKRHSIALKVLAARGPRLILGLPAAALRPELEPAVSAIFRHLLEDPVTLQAAMEAEIRNVVSSCTGGARGAAGGGPYAGAGAMQVHKLLSVLAPVIAREPTVFFEAVMATCTLQDSPDGEPVVILKKPKDTKGERRADGTPDAGPCSTATPRQPPHANGPGGGAGGVGSGDGDASAAHRRASGASAGPSGSGGNNSGGGGGGGGAGAIFRHIMHVHLPSRRCGDGGAPAAPGLAEQTSFFLLAVCIRSAEGRRRIVAEIVRTLGGDGSGACPALGSREPAAPPAASVPFLPRPGAAPPAKVQAFVELVGSLLQATERSVARPGGRNGGGAQGLSTEVVRSMREAGVVGALTAALKLVDLDHPRAPGSINAILKPLEVLTQPLPPRPQGPSSGGPGHTGAGGSAANGPAPAGDGRGSAVEAGGGAGEGRAADARMGEPGEDEAPRESAAGPEAVAAAERAMGRLGGRDGGAGAGDGRGVRSAEDMMERFIERAYASELGGMGGFGSENEDGSDDADLEDHDGGEGDSDEDEAMLGEEPMPDLSEEDSEGEEEGEEGDEEGGSGGDGGDEAASPMYSDEGSSDGEEGAEDDDDNEEEVHVVLQGDDADGEDDEDLEADMAMEFEAELNADGRHLGAGVEMSDEDEGGGPAPGEGEGSEDEELEVGSEGVDFDAGGDDEEGWEDGGDLEDDEGDGTGTPRWVPRANGAPQLHGVPPAAMQAMMHELMNMTNAAGGGDLGAAQVFGGIDMRQRGIDLRQRARRMGLGGGHGGGIGPLSVGPPFVLATAGGVPQHRLLQRPATAAGSAAARGQAGAAAGAPIIGGPQPLLHDGAGGSYLVIPTAEDMQALAGAGARLPVAMAGGHPGSMINVSIDMLLGGGGGGAGGVSRPEARMGDWAPDGQAPDAATADAFAGQLEEPLLAALRAAMPPAPPPEPGPSAGEAPEEQPGAAAAVADAGAADDKDRGSDEDMPDAPAPEPAEAVAPDAPAPAADVEMAAAPVPGSSLGEELSRVAQEAGIDLAFLEALPPELRAEVLSAHGAKAPEPAPAAASAQPAVAAAAEPAAAGISGAEPAGAAAEAQPAGAPAAGGDGEPEEMEGIDPEFLAALPPDMQAEVLEQQRLERRRRQAALQQEARVAAAAAAAAAGGGGPAAAQEPDLATTLAGFPPDVREEVLMTADESVLSQLPPALLAEAQALRERMNMRGFRQPHGALAGGGAARAAAFSLDGGQPGGLTRTMRRTFQQGFADGRPVARRALGPPGAGALDADQLLLGDVADEGLPRQFTRRTGGAPGGGILPVQYARRTGPGGMPMMMEPPPQVDDEALATLVSLLRLSQPLAKNQLQRLFLNLCWHPDTRKATLRILLSLLRAPPAAGRAAAARGSAAQPSEAPRSLADAMQDERMAMETDSGTFAAPLALFTPPPAGAAASSERGSALEVPPMVSRRVLDLATYLARHQGPVGRELVLLRVPTAAQQAHALAAAQDKKGKGRVEEAAGAPGAQGERALELLLELLGGTLCRRSSSHMEQVLHLLETVLSSVVALMAIDASRKDAMLKLTNARDEALQQRSAAVVPSAISAITRVQEALAEARRSLASAEAADAASSGSSRAAAVSEVPLRAQLASIAQLCIAAREDVNSAEISGRMPVLFPPRPAEAPAGAAQPPRLPPPLMAAMADANEALLAVWSLRMGDDKNRMTIRLHSALLEVNFMLRRLAIRTHGSVPRSVREVLVDGWREALAAEAVGTRVQDSAVLAGLARIAAEEHEFVRTSAGDSHVTDDSLQHQCITGVLHRDPAAADVLACLGAICRSVAARLAAATEAASAASVQGPTVDATAANGDGELPPALLAQLPSLLGARGLSAVAAERVAACLRALVAVAPAQRPLLLAELEAQLRRLTSQAVSELRALIASDLSSSAAVAAGAGAVGAMVLRVLQAVADLIRDPASQAPKQGPAGGGAGQGSVQGLDQGGARPGREAGGRAPSAGPSRMVGGPLARVQSATAAAPAGEAAAALEAIARQTEPLWAMLSDTAGRIEAGLAAVAPHSDAAPASRVLPPGAAQVLPLVEAFFVLCDARTAQLGLLPPGTLRGAASSELPGFAAAPPSAALGAAQVPQVPPATPAAQTPAAAAAAGGGARPATAAAPGGAGGARELPAFVTTPAPVAERSAVDAHLPFLRFAERHRRLLNALLRQNAALLDRSLAPLLRAPRLIDFDNKRAHFRARVRASGEDRTYGTLRICVRREHVFEDSFHQLRMRTPEEMRWKLSVQFQGEEGIDAGGLTREWYQVMAREMFNPNFSLFVPMPEGGATFQPNPNSTVQNDPTRGTDHLDFFRFVGRVVGKALHDGLLVDAYFTRSFYKHCLGQPLTYQDIEAVDPEYYKNLRWMLEHDISDVLDLTFTEEVDYFGRKEVVDLKLGGATLKVTEENKKEYVNLVAQHRMTTAIRGQLQAFLSGFWDLVPKDLIALFNDHELELLISGLPEIDVDDLRANTEYTGFTAASPVIQWFWQVVREMDKEELALLVQFVTGTSKVPLEGFKALQGIGGPQRFQIHRAYGPQDRLPSAHTCFNQLDLIEYASLEQLRDRLALALREGSEGFGFG